MIFDNFMDVLAQKEAGTFDSASFKWAIGENHIPVLNKNGFTYEDRLCIYILCEGSQQVYGEFPLKGTPSHEMWALAEQIIRQHMGVEHILRGVG